MGKKKDIIVEVDMYNKYAEIDEMYSTKCRKIKLSVPSNFRMLCAILDVKVEQILNDFMWMLSYSYHKTATGKQRKFAQKFFQVCKYGEHLYTKKQIEEMFDELRCERKIYETIDTMEHNDLRLFWKNNHMYMQYWYKRWFNKIDRAKGDISVLNEH
ncbi:hypothetical protein [Sphingobacterium sp. BN32]|uniref:hypothetical protein n=1 Tax=Sphingobacterium sp. BN32 TaxID=3058432 RepID=UPI00265CC424|nr:hypothetical protein [Sphingobacterium sp. BN32]WKK60355.1 hypothetical protein QYC40_08950 [Sphingobacterium sp. BN32]